MFQNNHIVTKTLRFCFSFFLPCEIVRFEFFEPCPKYGLAVDRFLLVTTTFSRSFDFDVSEFFDLDLFFDVSRLDTFISFCCPATLDSFSTFFELAREFIEQIVPTNQTADYETLNFEFDETTTTASNNSTSRRWIFVAAHAKTTDCRPFLSCPPIPWH